MLQRKTEKPSNRISVSGHHSFALTHLSIFRLSQVLRGINYFSNFIRLVDISCFIPTEYELITKVR